MKNTILFLFLLTITFISAQTNTPDKIVQKQVDTYNAGNLDAFISCYTKDVVVRNFPSDTLYIGHEKMRMNYSGLSPTTKRTDVKVVNRMIVGNHVIDLEKITRPENEHFQVAIYEVKDSKISSMNFIFDKKASKPETIVQKQLDFYNAKDIEGFSQTFSTNVKIYNFPATISIEGLELMRERYNSFFKSTPDLHSELKNRIVIGNKVIDQEYVTANGNHFSVIAIYEVENDKIAKVTFLR